MTALQSATVSLIPSVLRDCARPSCRDDPSPSSWAASLRLAGLLLFALYLGKVRRTGSLVWTMPLSANLVLRNFGLTIFLAQVGMASGPKFFTTVAATGPVILLY